MEIQTLMTQNSKQLETETESLHGFLYANGYCSKLVKVDGKEYMYVFSLSYKAPITDALIRTVTSYTKRKFIGVMPMKFESNKNRMVAVFL